MKPALEAVGMILFLIVVVVALIFGLFFVTPWVGGHLFHGFVAALTPMVGVSWAKTISVWALIAILIALATITTKVFEWRR